MENADVFIVVRFYNSYHTFTSKISADWPPGPEDLVRVLNIGVDAFIDNVIEERSTNDFINYGGDSAKSGVKCC